MEASFQPAPVQSPVPIGRGRADYRATDARILRVAAQALTEDPHVSVSAIAERAGVSRATMYRHYSSVSTILEVLRTRALDAERPARDRLLATLMRPEPTAVDIVGAFSTYVRDTFGALDDGAPGPRAIVVWDPGLRAALATDLAPPARQAITRLQRLGVVSPDFDADTLLGMLASIMLEGLRQVTTGALAPQDAAALVQHSALIGLRARARRDAEVATA